MNEKNRTVHGRIVLLLQVLIALQSVWEGCRGRDRAGRRVWV